MPSGQLTVTYAGSTTKPTNAGSYAVVASLNDANYEATDATDTFVIAKAGQQINGFDQIAAKTFGNAEFNVSATATSGVPVTFTATGNCTVSGNTVHLSGAGSCTVTAKQAGNTNYNAATDVSQTFQIAKANQTITFNAPSGKTFGGPDFDLGATASSGLAVSYQSSTTGVCPIDSQTNKLHIVSAGTCTVTAAQAGNTNYDAAQPASQQFSVAKRQAAGVYTGDNYAAVASGNATINLSAKVSRLSGSLGDLSKARVQFTVKNYGGGNVQGTPVLASVDANGNAAATASVPTSVNPYTVEVQVDPANTYWTSGKDVSSLQVIALSGSARTAGGGWIADAANDINGKSNFGFSVQNAKSGIKGNSLFIYRVKEGANEVQYVVKSNSWVGGGLAFNINNDPAKATFTGKATVQRYVNGVFDTTFNSGGYTFTVDDFDGDLKSPRVTDGYAIVLRNSSNQVVKQLGTRSAPVTLGGGNVLIQVK